MIWEHVLRKQYMEPPLCEQEVFRYAGCPKATEETRTLMRSCFEELRGVLTYRVCFATVPLAVHGTVCDLHFVTVDSTALSRQLKHCHHALVFGATVGLELDRRIARYSRQSPAKALMLQAIGAERIEALCNQFCQDIDQELSLSGQHLTSRFSPGYGDLPLTMQPSIFSFLDCNRQIGLTLNNSLFMSPSKSVTAIAGISNRPGNLAHHSCGLCTQKDCAFRRR